LSNEGHCEIGGSFMTQTSLWMEDTGFM